MTSKRLYFVLWGLIGLFIVGLVGGAYEADRLLQARSKGLMEARLKVAVLDQEQAELNRAKQDIKKYHDLAVIAKSVVPQDKDQAQTVREVVNIAGANKVSLGSVSFPTSTLGLGPGGKPSTSGGKQQLSQLVPVAGISGVYSLQLTVQSDSAHPVAYSRFISFLTALEHNRRTAQVSSVTIQPNVKDRTTLSFTLVLDEYIKP